MSTYDMLIQKGIQLGIRKVNEKVIRNGLKEGLSIEILATLTRLSEEKVRQIITEIQK